jgi:hypothetical protein
MIDQKYAINSAFIGTKKLFEEGQYNIDSLILPAAEYWYHLVLKFVITAYSDNIRLYNCRVLSLILPTYLLLP